ncbi:MAG TPA: redoxin domain-containing protein [Spirochaetes bacterium]|nr:redoxin domain-containing protein [Spirochaetota bacterium]
MKQLTLITIILFLTTFLWADMNQDMLRAVTNGNEKKVSELIKKGADVNADLKDGYTPLHFAALTGNMKIITLLVTKGSKIKAKAKDGTTALHFAAYAGHIKVVQFLIEKKADLNAKLAVTQLNQFTPLHVAVWRNNLAITQLLVNKGASLKDKTDKGFTPLHIAVEHNQLKIAEFLIQKGASVSDKDKKGQTPLHIAAEKGSVQMAQILIKYKANINAKDSKSQSPLDIATKKKDQLMIRILKGGKLTSEEKTYYKILTDTGLEIINIPASNFTLKDLKGKDVSLKQFKGKMVFLNIWATWCLPCRAEMPSMEKVYQKLKTKNFVMLAISTEAQNVVQPFISKSKFSFTILIDSKRQTDKLFPGNAIPRTYIINKEGIIIAKHVGSTNWEDEKYIKLFNLLAK